MELRCEKAVVVKGHIHAECHTCVKDISVFHPRVDTCLYHRDAIKENRTAAKILHNIKLHASAIVIIKTGNLGVVLERRHAEAVKK